MDKDQLAWQRKVIREDYQDIKIANQPIKESLITKKCPAESQAKTE